MLLESAMRSVLTKDHELNVLIDTMHPLEDLNILVSEDCAYLFILVSAADKYYFSYRVVEDIMVDDIDGVCLQVFTKVVLPKVHDVREEVKCQYHRPKRYENPNIYELFIRSLIEVGHI